MASPQEKYDTKIAIDLAKIGVSKDGAPLLFLDLPDDMSLREIAEVSFLLEELKQRVRSIYKPGIGYDKE